MNLEKCTNDNGFNCCLFFVANEFSRLIGEMAEKEFNITGLSPSYAFVLMLVNKNPGIHPNELSSLLKLKPSTITRLLDKLVYRGFIDRSSQGRQVIVHSTKNGEDMQPLIEKAWQSLFVKYSEILGREKALALTSDIGAACKVIENNL